MRVVLASICSKLPFLFFGSWYYFDSNSEDENGFITSFGYFDNQMKLIHFSEIVEISTLANFTPSLHP